jgi:hypothetical protein
VCQRQIAAQASIRYAAIVKDAKWPSIMNLSTQHEAGNALTIRDMRRAFTKLRRLKWFKEKVRGGVAGFEVTQGDHGMHVHVHCIIDCKWCSVTTTAPRIGASKEEWRRKGMQARKELSEQWSLCTGRTSDVWIKRESDVEKIVREQLKYNVKGSDLADRKKVKGRVAPIIRSMTGCRLLSSWGTMYRHPAIKRTKPAPKMCKCGCNDWMLERSVDLIVQKLGVRRRT